MSSRAEGERGAKERKEQLEAKGGGVSVVVDMGLQEKRESVWEEGGMT